MTQKVMPRMGVLETDGAVHTHVASSVLPLDAATKTKQEEAAAILTSIEGKVLTADELRAAAVPISAAALPLPADAATQTTLALIKVKTDNIPAQGQAIAGGSLPVVLPVAQIATLTPIAGNLEATQLLVKAKTDNLDVAISTRLKPADTLAGVTTVAAVTAITNPLPAGTNAIGKLTANSGVDIGDVDVTSLPALAAGSAKIGGAYPVSGQQIDEGGVVRAVSRSFANATLIGNTQVVAAQGGAVKIRVLAVLIVATLSITAKFQSATTDISAGFPIGANGGMVLPYNPHGWFETSANEALNLNLSLGTATGIQVVWCPAA